MDQSVVVVSNAAFTRVGTKLYVVGGGLTREIPRKHFHYSGPDTTVGDGQLTVLDLSAPFDNLTPPWKRLQNGPKQINLGAALNADGTKIATFHSGPPGSSFGMLYDVATNTWTNSTALVPQPDREGIPAVLDPETNKVYLATGYEADGKGDQMYIYNFSDDKMLKIPMTESPLINMVYFAGAWNSAKKSVMYFGGRMPSGDNGPGNVYQFTPSSGVWTTL
ncbi:hypothetical protein BG004_002755, partial [Podila humilis]